MRLSPDSQVLDEVAERTDAWYKRIWKRRARPTQQLVLAEIALEGFVNYKSPLQRPVPARAWGSSPSFFFPAHEHDIPALPPAAPCQQDVHALEGTSDPSTLGPGAGAVPCRAGRHLVVLPGHARRCSTPPSRHCRRSSRRCRSSSASWHSSQGSARQTSRCRRCEPRARPPCAFGGPRVRVQPAPSPRLSARWCRFPQHLLRPCCRSSATARMRRPAGVVRAGIVTGPEPARTRPASGPNRPTAEEHVSRSRPGLNWSTSSATSWSRPAWFCSHFFVVSVTLTRRAGVPEAAADQALTVRSVPMRMFTRRASSDPSTLQHGTRPIGLGHAREQLPVPVHRRNLQRCRPGGRDARPQRIHRSRSPVGGVQHRVGGQIRAVDDAPAASKTLIPGRIAHAHRAVERGDRGRARARSRPGRHRP